MRLSSSILALAVCAGVASPAIANASAYVTNGNIIPTNYSYPGYTNPIDTQYNQSQLQPISIAGWSGTGGYGATPYNGSGFFDNGSLPAGDSTVGFIQGAGSLIGIMNDLKVNDNYTLSFLYNARAQACCDALPTFTVTVGTSQYGVGGIEVGGPVTVTPVGGSNPFYSETVDFTAKSSSEFFDFASNTPRSTDGTALFSDVSVAASPTPEPTSLSLLGTGLAGLAALRRRFKK